MRFQESDTIELKEQYIEDIRKEIIAFANTKGGTIYIGVSDDGTVVGLENPDAVALQIANVCRDTIKPDITMFVAYSTLEADGKIFLAVHVQCGTSRPYYLSAKGLRPAGVFTRQGSASAPASDEAIRKMIKETDGDQFEEMRSLNQELTFEDCKKEFATRGLEFGKTQMRTLGLLNNEDIYTNLALLLSDQCPHIIKAATFGGTSQNEFQDRKEFTGSLLKQLRDAYSYLEMRNQTKAIFDGLYRIDSPDYKPEVLREALLNAIVHRDYSNLAGTIIGVYTDRMEIISYGGLTGGVSLEDILNGLSICRNRKLADIFYRLKLIEAYGTGLQRIMRAYTAKSGKPQFLPAPSSFKVILPNNNSMPTSEPEPPVQQDQDESAQILALLQEQKTASRNEISARTGLSASSAVRVLKQLKEAGAIYTTGKGKNTRYTRTAK